MSQLKVENLKKCFSLLREFIDEAPLDNKKKIAALALNQLQKITAGTDSSGTGNGGSVPQGGTSCAGRLRVDGTP